MSRKPKVPVGELARIKRAGLLWRVARRLFAPAVLARQYGVTGNVIEFIQRGGRYKSYPRAYVIDTQDSQESKADSTPVLRLLEDAFLEDLARTAEGRARLLSAVAGHSAKTDERLTRCTSPPRLPSSSSSCS